MAAGGLTKREEEESVWDNLVDDSGEDTGYRATPIVGFENGDWDIELPGVETEEEETVDTDTGNTETEVAPVVEQQTNVAGALGQQTEEQTEQQVPEEVGQRLVRSNTEEEHPVITEEAEQTPANLWTQWENLQNAEEDETAQQNTAQAEEEQRLVQPVSYSEQDIQNAVDFAVRDLGIPADMVTEDYAIDLLNSGAVTPTGTETLGDWANNLVSAGVPTATAEAYYNPDTGQVTYDTLGEAILGDMGLRTGGRGRPNYDSFAGMLAGQAFDLQPLGDTQDLPSANQGVIGTATNAQPETQPEATTPQVYIPRDKRGGFTPQNLPPEIAAAMEDFNPYAVDLSALQSQIEAENEAENQPYVQEEEPFSIDLQHAIAKGEQSVVNSVIIDRDRNAYVLENLGDIDAYASDQERMDREDELMEEYDRLYPNGRPELDLLATDEILENINAVNQAEQDRIDALRQEGTQDTTIRSAAWQAALDAGLDPSSPEFANFVDDYETEWKRRNEQSSQYEDLIESQNVDRADVNEFMVEHGKREAEQRRQDYIDTLMERSNARDEYELRNNRYIYGAPGYMDNGEPDTIRPNDAMEQLLRGGQYGYGSEAPVYNADGTPNDLLQAILDGKFSQSMEEWGMYLQGLGVLTPENAPKYQEYLRVSNAEAALSAFDLRDGTGYQGLVVPDEIKPFIASNFGKSIGNEQTMYMTSDGQLQLTEKNENIEKVRATEEQYRAALDALIEANPSMKAMIDAGIVTKDDIMFHFMKGLIVTKPGSGKGSGTGTARYGGGGGGGYGGGGRGGGSYGSSGGNSAKRQQESRINNIMKNWTF